MEFSSTLLLQENERCFRRLLHMPVHPAMIGDWRRKHRLCWGQFFLYEGFEPEFRMQEKGTSPNCGKCIDAPDVVPFALKRR